MRKNFRIISMNRNFFELSLLEVIDLDLKLKLTKYDRKWNYIRNHLFSFYNLSEYDGQINNELKVDDKKFKFLKLLNQKNFDDIPNINLNSKIKK